MSPLLKGTLGHHNITKPNSIMIDSSGGEEQIPQLAVDKPERGEDCTVRYCTNKTKQTTKKIHFDLT